MRYGQQKDMNKDENICRISTLDRICEQCDFDGSTGGVKRGSALPGESAA